MVHYGMICEPAMCVSPSAPVLVADATHERRHQGEESSAPYKIILSVKFKSHNDCLRKQSLDKYFKKHNSKLALTQAPSPSRARAVPSAVAARGAAPEEKAARGSSSASTTGSTATSSPASPSAGGFELGLL